MLSVDTQSLKTRLRDAGLRSTPARLAVLRLLSETNSPISHADLVARLADQDWDRATLYRNLTDLAASGLVVRTDLGDRVWRFELAGTPGHAAKHPHFVCTSCGDVACLDGVLRMEFSADPAVPLAVRAGSVEVQVRGACDRCASGSS